MNKNKKWYILILMCLGILAAQYSQFLMSQLGMTWLSDNSDLGGDAATELGKRFSTLMTAPLIAGALLSLVSGLFVDKFGVKKVLMVSFAIMTAGSLGRIFTGSYGVMFVCMVSLGIITTFFNANIMKLAGTWFAGAQAALAIGIFSAVNSVSAASGTMLGAMFGSNYTLAFITSAVFAVAVWILWAVTPMDNGQLIIDNKDDTPKMRDALKIVVRCKAIWVLAAAMMCISVAGNAFGLFLPEALKARGISAGTAGLATFFGIIGSGAFNLVAPKVMSRVTKPRLTLVFFGILGALCIGFAWLLEIGPLMYLGLFIGGACSLGLSPVLLQLPLSFKEIGQKYAGTAGGFIATLQLGGCVIVPTYIFMPLSKGNNTVFFALEGSLMLIFAVLAIFLPVRSLKEKKL
ncbi:MAG: MFS transporter [Oscillospiraceae bacterium]|jgi:NNP family nitrate/nitrite transporter-like MFS transporter|nr:MFS transporter [Oscillospiraceae bacterium]